MLLIIKVYIIYSSFFLSFLCDGAASKSPCGNERDMTTVAKLWTKMNTFIVFKKSFFVYVEEKKKNGNEISV